MSHTRSPGQSDESKYRQVVGQFDAWEFGPVRGHIGWMTTLDKCMSVLRPLIAEGDTKGVGAAERAVNEYVAATEPSDRKNALLNVQQALQAHREEAPGINLSFADTVNDYIEKLMRGFE